MFIQRSALAFLIAGCSGGTPPSGPAPGGPQTPTVYVPGTSYFGTSDYIEYIAGNLPLIFSAPHGGQLTPAEIGDRTAGACGGEATTVRDANTSELARGIQAAFFAKTGKYPHIVIAHLHRRKLDPNRPRVEAGCGNTAAGRAFDEYHQYIDVAKARVLADHGKGWYTDLHGHGHAIQRLELGYLLSGAELRLSDATLDGSVAYENSSSIRTFSQQSPLSFAELLRGPQSLGAALAAAGYPAVPSDADAQPDEGEDYFSGGYSTDRHGCRDGGNICGLQIEHNMTGVRDTEPNRAAYASALVQTYLTFLASVGIPIP